jgi:hypothetical protein
MAPDSARAALDALWVCLVEQVEVGHDTIVWSQTNPSSRNAADIIRIAEDTGRAKVEMLGQHVEEIGGVRSLARNCLSRKNMSLLNNRLFGPSQIRFSPVNLKMSMALKAG